MEQSGLHFGAAYYIDGVSLGEIRADLEAMVRAGMNLVRLGAKHWEESTLRALPGVLALCRELGLMSVLALPELPEETLEILEQVDADAFQVTANAPWTGRQLERLQGKRTVVKTELVSAANPFGAAGKNMLGCGIFHEAGLKNTGSELNFQADLARAAAKDNFWVLETQSQGALGQLPYPGQLRLAAFHHVASGAGCVCYWPWNSETSAGTDWQGIIGYDGQPGRAYREISQIGREFSMLETHLAGLSKRSRIGILVSPRSARLMPKIGGKGYDDYLKWVCDSFYRLNIEVELVEDKSRDFSRFALLVTPCLYSAGKELTEAIRDYVARGGCLLSTFRSFFADEEGNLCRQLRPCGMTDVFSMHYSEFTVPEEVCLPEYMAEVSEFMELLRLDEAMGLAIYDSPAWRGVPAACCSRFGKGQAAYFGCYSEEGFEPILLRLLAMWHIPVPETAWPVVQKRGINRDGKNLTFLLHYSPASRVIPSPATGVELFSGRHLDEGEPLELKGWDVKILEGDL